MTVITVTIVRYVITGVSTFVTGINGTAYAVIADNRDSNLTGAIAVTGLVTVAEFTVCTGCSCRAVRTVCLAAAWSSAVGGCPVVAGFSAINITITAKPGIMNCKPIIISTSRHSI